MQEVFPGVQSPWHALCQLVLKYVLFFLVVFSFSVTPQLGGKTCEAETIASDLLQPPGG